MAKLNSGIIIFDIILPIILFSSIFADEPYSLERIVIRGQKDNPAVYSLKNNYSFQVLTSQQIKEKNARTITELLDYISGLDLRTRGNFGIQGDLSLRGSTYEQVAVLVDGVNLNDPQTGHHNLDIPLTVFDIDRVEVVKEGISSLYGKGALSGSVNIITKKPVKKAVNLDMLSGEHALRGLVVSFSLPQENLMSRVSFDYKISKGAVPNTDFEYNTTSLYLNRDFDGLSLDALFGYQKKDFGADSFYSNLFPEEEEHTETLFIRTGLDSRSESINSKNNLFFRKHKDKFILRRNNPTSTNYHTTYIYGANTNFNFPTNYGDFLLGFDVGRDEINSNNLGKHTRSHEAGSFGLVPELGGGFSADLRLRLDYYQKCHPQESFNLGLGYGIIEEKLKIKGSISEAFRIPSFTELYYSDSANRGDASLKIEKSKTFSLNLEFIEDIHELSLGGFFRQGENLIDWTRATQTEPWQATNLGRVNFYGMEFIYKLKPRLNFKEFKLDNFDFAYNYTVADEKRGGLFSKYALDILKHQFMLDIYLRSFGLNFNWNLSYNQRYYGETYFIGNIYIGKKFLKNNFNLEPFIRIDNFSDTKYTEVAGVLQPGRWLKSGLKFEW